jgi:hypothetical protein
MVASGIWGLSRGKLLWLGTQWQLGQNERPLCWEPRNLLRKRSHRFRAIFVPVPDREPCWVEQGEFHRSERKSEADIALLF